MTHDNWTRTKAIATCPKIKKSKRDANIGIEIKTDNIEKKFFEGMKVAIVSGFQGISKENRISTLGRGGSDTTAVAISAAFNAKRWTTKRIKRFNLKSIKL